MSYLKEQDFVENISHAESLFSNKLGNHRPLDFVSLRRAKAWFKLTPSQAKHS